MCVYVRRKLNENRNCLFRPLQHGAFTSFIRQVSRRWGIRCILKSTFEIESDFHKWLICMQLRRSITRQFVSSKFQGFRIFSFVMLMFRLWNWIFAHGEESYPLFRGSNLLFSRIWPTLSPRAPGQWAFRNLLTEGLSFKFNPQNQKCSGNFCSAFSRLILRPYPWGGATTRSPCEYSRV